MTERPESPSLPLLDSADRRRLEAAFRRALPLDDGLEPHLAAAVRDVLDHPGSLARAQLADSAGRRFGLPAQGAEWLALGIECFHTASLVFDDLPSMDDASTRRGRPCPHRLHGEAAATLAALALVTRGYALVWRALAAVDGPRSGRAMELVEASLGLGGILGGQASDLHFGGGGVDAVTAVARGKTVPLIRLTLVLPALAGNATSAELAALEEVAESWGLAYQAVDDLRDRLLSRLEAGKSTARDALLGRPNLLLGSGEVEALDRLSDLLARGHGAVADAVGSRGAWPALARLGELLDREADRLAERLCLESCA